MAKKAKKKTIEKANLAARQQQSRAVALHDPRNARPPEPPPNVLQIIARAAADPAVQPDKMRALLDMQKEIMAEEARRAFTVAFAKMSAKLPTINAKGRIEIEAKKPGGKRQDTPYATFNEIHRVTQPILREHGFVISYAPGEGHEGRLVMHGTLEHVGGHFKTGTIALPLETSGSKNNVQGVGSSIAYGKRYLTVTLLNLVSEAMEDRDDDGQAAGGAVELISEEQAGTIVAKCAEAGLKGETLLKRLNEKSPKNSREIKTLNDIPADRFDETIERIGVFAAAKAARAAAGEPEQPGAQQ